MTKDGGDTITLHSCGALEGAGQDIHLTMAGSAPHPCPNQALPGSPFLSDTGTGFTGALRRQKAGMSHRAQSQQPPHSQWQGREHREDAGLARSTHCWVRAVQPHLEQTPRAGSSTGQGRGGLRTAQAAPETAWELSPAFLSSREHEVPTLRGLFPL